jgi:hypothetical protein
MSTPATFVFKPVATFPLKLELDCPVGKGYFTLDCKVRPKKEITALREKNLEDREYFDELVTAVHGCPDGLEGEAATAWFCEGPVSMWALDGFVNAYFEQYGDARRKNGQKLRGR